LVAKLLDTLVAPGVESSVVASLLYKNYLIVATASFDENSQTWTPTVFVSWRTPDGKREFHTIESKAYRFDHRADAETFGIQLAKSWVDSVA